MQHDRVKTSRAKPRSDASDSLDASAVFEDRAFIGDIASNVEVVVKRQRTLQADDDSPLDGPPAAEAATVRAPRVFRVEGSVEPKLEQVEELDLPTQVAKPRLRRRRVLHGEVKIIRPASTDSPARAKGQGLSDLGRSVERDSGFLDFGVGQDEGRRYATLMTEIAKLERQAKAAKAAEAAAAVRWIRKAIVEYTISKDELGL